MSIKTRLLAPLCIGLCTTYVIAADDTHAERAIAEAGQTSGHASASAAHSIAASGQVTSAVSAVPLSIGGAALGSAGAASAASARDSMRAATAPIGTPLPITDESVTVVPPDEALKKRTPKGGAI